MFENQFESVKERIEAIYRRKDMDCDQIYRYIIAMHPINNDDSIDMNIITGLIRFIYDNIGLGAADIHLHDNSEKRISCYMDSVKAVFISNECVIECDNFSSQYATISVRDLDSDAYNNTFILFDKLNFLDRRHTIFRLMNYLASIIVSLYR